MYKKSLPEKSGKLKIIWGKYKGGYIYINILYITITIRGAFVSNC